MVHINKARLQKGLPTKLQMKRVGSWKILAKCGVNSYKVELPSNLDTSHIFNVQELVSFKDTLPQISLGVQIDIEPTTTCSVSPLKIEQVLDSRVNKYTRHKIYMEHLIKWKRNKTIEATWVAKTEFKKVDIPLDMFPLGSSQFPLRGGSMVQEHLGRIMIYLGFSSCFQIVVMLSKLLEK